MRDLLIVGGEVLEAGVYPGDSTWRQQGGG
jgi:hypothetical protein